MNRFWRHRLQPSPRRREGELPGGPDLALEGLRGLCALAVFYAHLFLPLPMLDPRWSPPRGLMWLNLGYAAVLMFFVLSGYVIGLVTVSPANPAAVGAYVLRRAARLWPLVAMVVGLGWLLAPQTGGRTILGNLLFLQNELPYPGLGLFPLLPNNPNLWSLNYEVIYYAAFLPVWIWAPRTVWVFVVLALPVCAHAAGLGVPQVFARYACGGLYWFAGLTVAWSGTVPVRDRGNWPAAFLTAYVLWLVAPLRSICLDWGLYSWAWPTAISPHRLDFLPAALWILLAVTGRAPRAQRALALICLTLATGGLGCLVVTGQAAAGDGFVAAALALAWGLANRDFSVRPLWRLAPLGAVSFGLYVVAAPVQDGQLSLLPNFSGSIYTFAVRLTLVVVLAVGAAWVLERRICSPLSAVFRRSRPHGLVPSAASKP